LNEEKRRKKKEEKEIKYPSCSSKGIAFLFSITCISIVGINKIGPFFGKKKKKRKKIESKLK